MDEAIRNLVGGDALVSKEGVFLKENGHYRATAPLNIDNNKIENLPEPLNDGDAATKKYVDDVAKSLTVEEALVKENGGYNIIDNAYINMNFGNIRNIGEPSLISDAATKVYVDETVVNTISNQIKQLNQLISVSASYHGDLIKDEYQFTFGGSTNSKIQNLQKYNGFLVPTFGVIKHFVAKPSGIKLSLLPPLEDSIIKQLINKYGLEDNPTPLYTLVLIEDKGKEIIDIGTMFFYFTNYSEVLLTDENRLAGSISIDFQFKPKKKNI